MGGTTTAKDVILAAAANKQHAVTANKALIAEDLPLIDRSFRSGGRRRKLFGYEAAVAGGVPVIRAMRDSLVGDSITRVSGIMNGTTNYILSKMAEEGLSYGDALKQAQQLGFAEADPTADVEGHDARNKLVILSQLAYGMHFPPKKVHCTGISGVADIDFEFAGDLGHTIKLLGVAETMEADLEAEGEEAAAVAAAASSAPAAVSKRSLDVFVSPCLVEDDSPLGATSGANNLVEVTGLASGLTSYAGAGAGRFPTAASVLADMVAIATGTLGKKPFPRPKPSAAKFPVSPALTRGNPRQWYVRAPSPVIDRLLTAMREDVEYLARGHGASVGYDVVVVSDATRQEVASIVKRIVADLEKKGMKGDADGTFAWEIGGTANPAQPIVYFPME
jgi:homoserine dehydrogenase